MKAFIFNFKKLYRTPSAAEMAQRELDDAQRSLLDAQSGQDYAKAMVQYHTNRIQRLEHMLRNHHNAS